MQTTITLWPNNGAVLLVGELGETEASNATVIAVQQARKLLSENSPRSGVLFDSTSHPDFCMITPEKNSQWVKIDQIRALITWAQSKPQISDKKIAVITPAHALNLAAANALLKTLEESSIDTLFILVTDKPSFLPATVRSRCQWIRLKNEFKSQISFELKDIVAKDLQALRQDKIDLVSVSERWIKQNPKQVLGAWQSILSEEITSEAVGGQVIRSREWWELLDALTNAQRILEAPNQPNMQLLLESLLVRV